MITTPLKPGEVLSPQAYRPLYEEAISYINERIDLKMWHSQIVEVPDYNAIILSPYDRYTKVMDQAVEAFKAAGWDCFWKSAYDARGPHHCFYVHKKHFLQNDINT